MTLDDSPVVSAEPVLYCQRHPKIETTLQCYQCGAPICHRCAHHTPVGYQCPDCQRDRKQRFERARPLDYGIALAVSLLLGGIAGFFLPLLGWFTIFVSPLAGTIIAEVVWRLVNRRYSSHLWKLVAAGIILGTLPHLLLTLGVAWSTEAGDSLWSWGHLLWPLVHMGLAIGTANARLRLGS